VTFKVEVNYVEIDAVVTDAQGKFVTDLTKDDFQITEGGAAQSITAFSRVEVPTERADPPLFRRAVVEPDVRSNRDAFNGRVLLIVMDDLQTDFRRTSRVQAAARQFIRRYVGANDMVAIVTTGGRTAAAQEFTSSQARLIAAVDKFMGQKSAGDTLGMERVMKARNTYETLRGVAEFLGPVHGRRKAVVWFGEGVDYDIGNPSVRDSDVVRGAMQSVIAAATRANVTFYAIDPRGIGAGLDEAIELTPLPDENNVMGPVFDAVRRAQDSLRTVAGETGGFAAVNQNDLNDAFARIIQENSSYYLLGYYPSADKRDGRFRSVDVRVTRPGLTVKARKGYLAPTSKSASRSAKDGFDPKIPAPIREALASPVPSRDVPLAVFAAPFAGVRPKASVAVTIEIDASRLPFAEKDGLFHDDLEIHIMAIDAAGKLQGGGRDTAPLHLRPASHDAVIKNGLRLTRRLELGPGRYQIHVAVREANGGAVGTIRQDLDVPDFGKGSLHISGIALTSASAARTLTANPDPEFKQVLPAPATTTRDFPRDDTLALFAEIYDNETARHKVAIKASVLAGDGQVVFTAGDERSTEELQGKKGGFGYTTKIPLAAMAPGRYLLRVEAQALVSKGATVARELEFRVR
jgi:VWFA-related protein